MRDATPANIKSCAGYQDFRGMGGKFNAKGAEERIHMVREALENSELPDSLTIDFLEAIRILLNPTGP
jgi:hypothetical protein